MGMSFFEFLIYAYQSGRFSWPYLDTSEADAKIKSILSHKNNRAGVIFLTAHYGAYELLGSYLSRNFGTVIITQKLHLPALNNLVHEWRLRIGFKYVDNSETMKIMRVLKSGGSLAILPDLDLPRFRKINVDFFRRPVELTVGPSTLALRAGALIVPLFIERTRCGYFIRVYDAVDFKPSGDTEKDYLALTNKWVAVFEEQLSRRPEEWVWWGERWKDDSPG
jgi:KDO2-lipid IV(A) lauroyltransferase